MAKRIKPDYLLEYDKIPPQAIDIEEAVIGAIMLEKNAMLEVNTFLKSEMFYKSGHQVIFQVIVNMQMVGAQVDILTVTEELRKKDQLDEVGGPFYITQLTSKVSSAAHIVYHAKIIEQKFIQREVIRVSSEYLQRGYDDSIDVSDLIDAFTIQIMKINTGITTQVQQIGAAVERNLDYIAEVMAGNIKPFGIKTHLTKFDRKTNGLQKGVTIIAARPGMGKTSLILQLINNISVDQNIPIALFELEMFEEVLVRWMIAQRTGIENTRLKKPYGQLEESDIFVLEKEANKIKHAPFYVDFSTSLNIIQLRSKLIQMKQMHNIQVAIVDYLQLMAPVHKSQNREGDVSEMSRGLHDLSKELDMPIIALSQLNRAVLTRPDKRPNLGDLRESGAIEQDADMVIFIHRPEKYGITHDDDGNSLKGVTELIFAKHRDGDNTPVEIFFDDTKVTFKDLVYEHPDTRVEKDTDPF